MTGLIRSVFGVKPHHPQKTNTQRERGPRVAGNKSELNLDLGWAPVHSTPHAQRCENAVNEIKLWFIRII